MLTPLESCLLPFYFQDSTNSFLAHVFSSPPPVFFPLVLSRYRQYINQPPPHSIPNPRAFQDNAATELFFSPSPFLLLLRTSPAALASPTPRRCETFDDVSRNEVRSLGVSPLPSRLALALSLGRGWERIGGVGVRGGGGVGGFDSACCVRKVAQCGDELTERGEGRVMH